MKSFLKDLKGFAQKAETKGMLIGKTIKVGPYTVRPEAVLGEGGFATIYRVKDSTSGAAYALKHMHLMGDTDAIADCQTEVDTLKRLREVPTVLTLRAVAYAGVKGQEQEAFLLLDMCQDNLVDYLSKRDSQLPDSQVITIFHAVCRAVAAMHHSDPPLAHRLVCSQFWSLPVLFSGAPCHQELHRGTSFLVSETGSDVYGCSNCLCDAEISRQKMCFFINQGIGCCVILAAPQALLVCTRVQMQSWQPKRLFESTLLLHIERLRYVRAGLRASLSFGCPRCAIQNA